MLTLSHSGDDLAKSLAGALTITRTPKDQFSDKGVIINEIFDGAECDDCPDQCPGFTPHAWRKTCQECKCPRETHAVYHEQLTSVRERLGFKHDSNTSRVDPRQMGYTWVPPGILTSAKIQRYFDVIPSEKVPKIGTQGERFRDKQLVYQLPKQDLALAYCKHVEESNRSSYEDFVAARNEIALDIGYVKDTPAKTQCSGCGDMLNQGEMAVTAPKFRDQILWHPRCFKCTTCDELLVDLTYCVHDDQIYCERHYAELLKPRCNACDEVSYCSALQGS